MAFGGGGYSIVALRRPLITHSTASTPSLAIAALLLAYSGAIASRWRECVKSVSLRANLLISSYTLDE